MNHAMPRQGAGRATRPLRRTARLGSAAIATAVVTAIVATPSATPDADAVAPYLAMRDDVNPKPRLRWIEDRVRDAGAPNAIDLLGQAMTDPDEAVRARAAELYERALASR